MISASSAASWRRLSLNFNAPSGKVLLIEYQNQTPLPRAQCAYGLVCLVTNSLLSGLAVFQTCFTSKSTRASTSGAKRVKLAVKSFGCEFSFLTSISGSAQPRGKQDRRDDNDHKPQPPRSTDLASLDVRIEAKSSHHFFRRLSRGSGLLAVSPVWECCCSTSAWCTSTVL